MRKRQLKGLNNKMNNLIIWEKDSFKITYLNNKYSLYDDDKLIINNSESLTPCNNLFFITCIKENESYKYQLLSISGDNIFGDDKTFEFISFNQELNKFTFYNYFNKIEIEMPTLSEDRYKLFYLFLRQIYNKKIIEPDEFQKAIDKISEKIENLSQENIDEIIENIELANSLYIKLNKPSYLKKYLIVLDDESEKNLLNAIINNSNKIFEDLTKDIIENPKIHELNKEIINNIILTNDITNLNQVLNLLNDAYDNFKNQMKYYESSRTEIFKSIESIKEYFQSKETIKYLNKNDFNYIKNNKNLFLNIMYNKSNEDIFNLLKHYDIT